MTVVSCNTKGLRDMGGTLSFVKTRDLVADGTSRVRGTDTYVLPNINSFNSTVGYVARDKLYRTIGGTTLKDGPFLKVYLNLRLLFSSSRRDPNISKLNVLGKGIGHFPPSVKLGVPRVK